MTVSGVYVLLILLASAVIGIRFALEKTVSRMIRYLSALGTVVILGGVVIGSAVMFGYGHVRGNIAAYSDQLSTGVPYETKGTIEENGAYIITVKEFGKSEFRTIHVKEMSPKIFTLVDGKPVAILTTPSDIAAYYGAPSTSNPDDFGAWIARNLK